jgi:hypothetical protein
VPFLGHQKVVAANLAGAEDGAYAYFQWQITSTPIINCWLVN